MKTGVALATLLGCLAAGCMGSTVRIKADGVFDNGTNVSTGGVIFDGTNSFEELTAPARAAINLGLFLGSANRDRETFTLTLQQGGKSGGMAVVGIWKAHLRGNVLQFEPHPLRFCDGRYEYIWILTQHEYDISAENVPINAEVVMIDVESTTAARGRLPDRGSCNRRADDESCTRFPKLLHFDIGVDRR